LFISVLSVGYTHAQFDFGVRAGLNYTNMFFIVPAGSTSISTQMKPGFQAGVVAENNKDNLFYQMGLLFVSQTCKFNEGSLIGLSNVNLNINYLRIPVNLMYKIDLNGMKFLLQGGPSLGIALSGKAKHEISGDKEKLKFGNGGISRFEGGVGLGTGLQFRNIQAVIEYNIVNNFGGSDSKITMYNHGFALNITYLFSK